VSPGRHVSAFGIAVLGLLWPADAGAWVARLSGTRPVLSDTARASALAPDGSVVVSMLTEATPGGCSVGVRRIDAVTGTIRWRRTVHGATYFSRCSFRVDGDGVRATPAPVIVDGEDRVFVGTPGPGVARLDGATGEVVWHVDFAGDDAGVVHGLALHGDELVVAGTFVEHPGSEDADADFAVVKVDRETGAARWTVRLQGELPPCEEDCDYDASPQDGATGVAVAEDGTVHVVGHLSTVDGGMFMVLSLDGVGGAERWRFTRPGAGWSVATSGDVVYASGTIRSKAVVVRLRAATGRPAWHSRIRGGRGRRWGTAAFVVPDPSGDVFVAGHLRTRRQRATHAFVTRLAGRTGHKRWRRVFRAAEQTTHVVHGLTSGASGDVAVVTSTTFVNPPRPTSSVRSLRRRDGRTRWSFRAGGAHEEAIGLGVLRLADGDLMTSGARRFVGEDLDAEVLRLERRAGAVRWNASDEGEHRGDDRAYDVAVTGDGDVVVAGTVSNGNGDDFLVAKLGGGTGALRWQHELDGADPGRPSGPDYATEVAATPDGGAVAIGSMVREDRGEQSPAMVRFDARGELVWQKRFHGCCPGVRGQGTAVRVREDGDVAAVVRLPDPSSVVVMLDGTSGAERWRHSPYGRTIDSEGFVLLPDGDVAYVDATYDWPDEPIVVRLAGDSGEVRWEQTLLGMKTSSAAGTAESVLVGGAQGDAPRPPAIVVRLRSLDGEPAWSTVLGHPEAAFGSVGLVRADGEGAVLAMGSFRVPTDDPISYDWYRFVAVLDEPTGAVRWMNVGPADGSSYADARFDATGNVVAAGQVDHGSTSDFFIVAFDGATGGERWRRTVGGNGDGQVRRLAIGPTGRAVAVGTSTWLDTAVDATVLSVDGTSGAD
jgi:outer membrane protein assembly factor BamB